MEKVHKSVTRIEMEYFRALCHSEELYSGASIEYPFTYTIKPNPLVAGKAKTYTICVLDDSRAYHFLQVVFEASNG